MDPLSHPSILARVTRLQYALLTHLQARPGHLMIGEPSRATAVPRSALLTLASGPGEAALLGALLEGLIQTGLAWEVRRDWFTWGGE